jgi:hypothetical protein
MKRRCVAVLNRRVVECIEVPKLILNVYILPEISLKRVNNIKNKIHRPMRPYPSVRPSVLSCISLHSIHVIGAVVSAESSKQRGIVTLSGGDCLISLLQLD